MVRDLFEHIADLRASGQPFAVATVIETTGSVSARTGARAVIDAGGRVVAGWVGGGCAESTTCSAARACLESTEPVVIDIDMDDEILGVGMPCGGHMRVFVEPVLPKPGLWIMGHGRVAECLALFGENVDLDVVVNDPGLRADAYPAGARLIQDDLDYAQLAPGVDDYVVIATQHKGDHESLQRALQSPARYIALIASRKRAGLVLDHLRDVGCSQADLARVAAPAGLDLGARTPEEIALCVISEIVLHRRHGSGQAMSLVQRAEGSPDRAVGG